MKKGFTKSAAALIFIGLVSSCSRAPQVSPSEDIGVLLVRPYVTVLIFKDETGDYWQENAVLIDKEDRLFITSHDAAMRAQPETIQLAIGRSFYSGEIQEKWVDWDRGIAIVRVVDDISYFLPEVASFADTITVGSKVFVKGYTVVGVNDSTVDIRGSLISCVVEKLNADWSNLLPGLPGLISKDGTILKEDRYLLYKKYILIKAREDQVFFNGLGGSVLEIGNKLGGLYIISDRSASQGLVVFIQEIKPLIERVKADIRQSDQKDE